MRGENLYKLEKYTYTCRANYMNFDIYRSAHEHNLL